MKMERPESVFDSNQRSGRKREAAFTYKDLLAIMGVVGLLGLIVVPVIANTKSGSQRSACVNNLSRVGRAFALWANDHGDMFPYQIPFQYTAVDQRGTKDHPLRANLWFQLSWVSNELVTPKILACPSDRLVKVAHNFNLVADGGFIHGDFQHKAISYNLSDPIPELGRKILSADRNMAVPGGIQNSSCAYFTQVYVVVGTNSTWMNFMHAKSGNLLFSDGSVEQTGDRELAAALSNPQKQWDSPESHFLYPRSPFESERER